MPAAVSEQTRCDDPRLCQPHPHPASPRPLPAQEDPPVSAIGPSKQPSQIAGRKEPSNIKAACSVTDWQSCCLAARRASGNWAPAEGPLLEATFEDIPEEAAEQPMSSSWCALLHPTALW